MSWTRRYEPRNLARNICEIFSCFISSCCSLRENDEKMGTESHTQLQARTLTIFIKIPANSKKLLMVNIFQVRPLHSLSLSLSLSSPVALPLSLLSPPHLLLLLGRCQEVCPPLRPSHYSLLPAAGQRGSEGRVGDKDRGARSSSLSLSVALCLSLSFQCYLPSSPQSLSLTLIYRFVSHSLIHISRCLLPLSLRVSTSRASGNSRK